jgi:hypothetical protein
VYNGNVITDKNIIIRDKSLAGGFTQIPNVVLRDPDLSAPAKCVYALLLSYAWDNASCFPGQSKLAEDMGYSERAIRTVLNELRANGLISWERRGFASTNLYYIEPLPESK